MGKYKISVWVWCSWLLVTQFVTAQPPDTLWTRCYGGPSPDRCIHMEATSDGGWILAGFKGGDFWVIKTDSLGDSLWSRTFGYGGPDVALFAAEIAEGNFMLFGIGCLDNVHCGSWLVRLNAQGDSLGSQFLSNGVAETVRRTADHGFILVGSIYGQQDDFWLLKTDSIGTVEWSSSMGGGGDQEAHAVYQAGNDEYLIGGQIQQSVARLQRVSADGDSLWTRTYPASGLSSCRAITGTSDGGFVFAGHTEPVVGGSADFMLMKVNAQGDSVWRHTYGTGADEYAYDMIPTVDNGYMLVGERTSSGTAYVVKTDAAGTLQWSQTYGLEVAASFHAVLQTADGGYLFGGEGDGNVWLVRLGSGGIVPSSLTVHRVGDDIVLRWADDDNPFYRIYSSATPLGPFTALEGSTAGHAFIIPDGISAGSRFFVVVGWDGN